MPGPEGKQLNYNDDEALARELSYLLGIDATGIGFAWTANEGGSGFFAHGRRKSQNKRR